MGQKVRQNGSRDVARFASVKARLDLASLNCSLLAKKTRFVSTLHRLGPRGTCPSSKRSPLRSSSHNKSSNAPNQHLEELFFNRGSLSSPHSQRKSFLRGPASRMTSPSSITSTITAAVSLLSGEAEGMYVCVVCVLMCLSSVLCCRRWFLCVRV